MIAREPLRRRAVGLLLVAALIAGITGVGTATAGPAQSANCGSTIGLRNGDFETPRVAANTYTLVNAGTDGLEWRNTAENIVELWGAPFQGVSAFSGSQFAELNAIRPGTLYQDLATVPGSTMVWRIAHKATIRDGESMWVRIGVPGSTLAYRSPRLTANRVGPDRNGWTVHSGSYTVPTGQTTTRFAFESDGTSTTSPDSGNLLDDIEFAFSAGACSDAAATNAGAPVTIDVLSNDVGAGLSVASIDANAGGIATIVAGRVRFTPTAGFSGDGSFTYTVRDAAGNTSSATSSVAVLPVGVDDTDATVEGTAVSIPVLANDLGSAKVVTGTTTPAHGTVAVVSGSSITYTPGAGFTGTDTFTYRATANGGSYDASVTVTVTASADLAISLGPPSPAAPLAGTEVAIAATVTNAGPSATASTATVNLPIGMAFISAAGCTEAARVVTCPLSPLADGSSTTINLLLRGTTAGTRTVTAQVTGTVADPDTLDNVASRAITVTPAADLSVAGSVSPAPLVPGTSATWTFVTTNNGPSPATAAQIVVTVDPSTLDAPRVAPTGCTEAPAGTFTCALGPIASGASATTAISGVVNAALSSSAYATAVVSSTTADPNAANNVDVVSDAVSPTADLSVSASALAATVDPGGIATFSFRVTNLGPSVARGVLLEIPIPAEYEVTGVPDSCTVNGAVSIQCGIGFLDVSGGAFSDNSGDLLVTGSVRSTSGPSLALTGTTSMNPSITDPVSVNNSATATSTVDVRADLAVVTGLSLSSPVPGLPTELFVSVTNSGPSTATAPILTLVVPAAFSPTSTPAIGCVPVTITLVSCTIILGDLAPGESRGLVISGQFPADATGVQSFITSVDSGILDPSLANNVSTLTPTLAPAADLTISGHLSPSPAVGGSSASYVLTITNDGPSTAVDPTVTVTLDPDLTGVPGGTCSGTTVVTCTLAGPLAPGASTTVTVATTVAAAPTGAISSSAQVSATTTDPDPGNNTVTIDDATVRTADIAVTAVFPSAQLLPGGSGSAVFEITNNGPSDTTVTPIRLTLPSGFILTDVDNGSACNPTDDPAAVICDPGPIAVGDVLPLVASFEVDRTTPGTPTPRVTAEAIASMAPGTAAPAVIIDPVSANNLAGIDYTLLPAADLAISGTAPELFAAGPGIGWLFTVDNLGPSSTGFFTLRVTVPAGAVLTGATELYPGHGATPTWGGPVVCTPSGPIAPDSLDCELAALGSGESLDVTLTFDMTGRGEGAVEVTGEVSSTLPDPDGSNNEITLSSGAVTAPVDPGPSGELPYTGSNSTGPLLIGGLLAALTGTVLLALARCSRRPETDR